VAVRLAQKYKYQSGGAYLVTFVSDHALLKGWEGGGTIKPSNWPKWLCWVTVDTDPTGKLYPNKFGLASVLAPKGIEKRSDVLKK